MKKHKNLKMPQELIGRDIILFAIIYFISELFLDFLSINQNSLYRWIVLGIQPIILVIIVYSKLIKLPYICINCSSIINIKFRDLFSMHIGSKRRIKCPVCRKNTWAEIKIDNNN